MVNTSTLKNTNTNTERYCSISNSLKESLKEVNLYKKDKKKLKTWSEYLKEQEKEQ